MEDVNGSSQPLSGTSLDERDERTFPPPIDAIMVYCLHCGKEYMSSEMVFRSGEETPSMPGGLWCCATPGCRVGGFGLDIFPVDPEWVDPNGRLDIGGAGDDDELDDDDDDYRDDEEAFF